MGKMWLTRDDCGDAEDVMCYQLSINGSRYDRETGIWRADGEKMEFTTAGAKALGLPELTPGQRVRLNVTFKVEGKP